MVCLAGCGSQPDQEWASRRRLSRLNDEAKVFQMGVQRSMEGQRSEGGEDKRKQTLVNEG